jgi:lipopolysaccharide assembly outer membrane protein LptD (OstA)
MPQLKHIQIEADNQVRTNNVDDAKGNVLVRITSIRPDEDRTVIHADEVVYHYDTGEIETRGNARITIEKAQ